MSALKGQRVALSIGGAPDREKLGFPALEIDRVLFTVCTALIREGCGIVYAGHLEPDGYTVAMFTFLSGTYAGQGVIPFMNVLPEPLVRNITFSDLMASAKGAHGVATIALSIGAQLYAAHRIGDELLIGEKGTRRKHFADEAQYAAWLGAFPVEDLAAGYTQARQAVSQMTVGRISMGGKMGLVGRDDDQYQGAMPGIAEEAILSLEGGKAYIPLAAFGGATRDVAIALDLLPEAVRTPRGPQVANYGEAMNRLQHLRDKLPASQIERLRKLSCNDRAEELAQEAISILSDWA
jgi:hypothetical protein